MANELAKFEKAIPVKANTQFCVDARQLHKALEVQDHFRTWIRRRIEKYGFQEGLDYEKSSMISSSANLRGGKRRSIPANPNPAIEYKITLSMAKELCMVENNNIGREARRYFIECERKLHEQQTSHQKQLPQSYTEALEELLIQVRRNEKQAIEIDQLQDENAKQDQQIQKYQMRLGEHPDFHKVSENPWIKANFNSRAFGQIGMTVKDLSEKMNIPIDKTPDKTNGHINVYHVDALSAFRIMCENNPEYLAKWRIDPDMED